MKCAKPSQDEGDTGIAQPGGFWPEVKEANAWVYLSNRDDGVLNINIDFASEEIRQFDATMTVGGTASTRACPVLDTGDNNWVTSWRLAPVRMADRGVPLASVST